MTGPTHEPAFGVDFRWGVRISLRDGIDLSANLYLPEGASSPTPALFTLTPYVAQTYHDTGLYFASHGFPFLAVDVRGRGNSDGDFWPLRNEGRDGHDIVEWLAGQPWCDGQVAMWGGSYAGFNQWATAGQNPRHLATIVPVAPCHVGTDYPMRNNIFFPYVMQWLLLVAGKTSQEKMFWGNEAYWGARFRQWAASGRSFDQLDGFLGTPSPVFQEWISHPSQGAYWDQYNPSPDSYADMSLPVLTITGIYDADQHGALHHYRQHVASSGGTADHYLVIGPWDHAGTRSPKAMFAGQEFGPASLVDLPGLHLDWYRWTMQGGPVPAFLKNRVAYYVTGLEQWRYADRLEAITQRFDKLYLGSCGGTAFLSNPGFLETSPGSGSPDSYIYDPCDLPDADREADVTDLISLRPLFAVDNIRDVEYVTARNGRQLVYDGPVFECDTAIVGFFRLELWLAINRPDTDFRVCIYEIDPDQGSTLLAVDTIRARFRESSHLENIIETNQPLHYDFSNFSFSSRLIRKGSRLRLTVGPADSIFDQRNYNNAKPVANQNLHDASPVAVCLFHDVVHSSVLHVPLANIDG